MRDTRRIAISLLAAVMFWGLLPRAGAQTAGLGALTGTLTDSSGAVVPLATIVVGSQDTGAERSVTTNGDGLYSQLLAADRERKCPGARRQFAWDATGRGAVHSLRRAPGTRV